MGNASPHMGEAVREGVEAAGSRLDSLPPYSPDFNPIGPAISKRKAALRRVRAGEGRL
jgi:transposase